MAAANTMVGYVIALFAATMAIAVEIAYDL